MRWAHSLSSCTERENAESLEVIYLNTLIQHEEPVVKPIGAHFYKME